MNAKSGSNYVPKPSSSRTTYLLGGLAVLVIAIVVIGGILWSSKRTETRNEGYGTVRDAAVVAQLQPDGAVLLGKPGAAKTLDMFEDPMCPACAMLEQTHGQEVAQAVDEGKLAVRYHMVNFLNRVSASGDYSTRAVAALQCIADTGSGPAYAAFHAKLYESGTQPEEGGSSDHSNAELADIAKSTGANDAAVQCISNGADVQSAAAAAEAGLATMTRLGAKGTPAVFDGTTAVNVSDSGWVTKLAG